MRVINKKLLELINKDFNNNGLITQKELAKKYRVSERTIRRYTSILKSQKIILYDNKKWIMIKKR